MSSHIIWAGLRDISEKAATVRHAVSVDELKKLDAVEAAQLLADCHNALHNTRLLATAISEALGRAAVSKRDDQARGPRPPEGGS